MNKGRIGTNIVIASLTISGLFSITSGAVLNKMETNNNDFTVKVIEKSTAKKKKTIPVLKEITTEENIPLSVDVKDYIENINEFTDSTINKFKLDTSLVNLTQPGTYTYTITYKDKTYNGNVIVNKKAVTTISNLTLKEISIELGKELPKNLNDFIVETIPEELKSSITIDLSKVNKNMAGTYQYTVTCSDKMYTGNITIYEAKPNIIAPEEETTKPEENKENNQ